MLKLLLILTVVGYLIYKVGTLLFRAGKASQRFESYSNNSKQPKKTKEFKGGDYIDYEDVKK